MKHYVLLMISLGMNNLNCSDFCNNDANQSNKTQGELFNLNEDVTAVLGNIVNLLQPDIFKEALIETYFDHVKYYQQLPGIDFDFQEKETRSALGQWQTNSLIGLCYTMEKNKFKRNFIPWGFKRGNNGIHQYTKKFYLDIYNKDCMKSTTLNRSNQFPKTGSKNMKSSNRNNKKSLKIKRRDTRACPQS